MFEYNVYLTKDFQIIVTISGKKGEQTVAVKTLKENASEKEKADLLQELNVMKNLGTHPNVVRLIACCTDMVREDQLSYDIRFYIKR